MTQNQFRAGLSTLTMDMQDIRCRDVVELVQRAGVVEGQEQGVPTFSTESARSGRWTLADFAPSQRNFFASCMALGNEHGQSWTFVLSETANTASAQ